MIPIPDDLYERLTATAALHGQTPEIYLLDLAAEAIEQNEQKAADLAAVDDAPILLTRRRELQSATADWISSAAAGFVSAHPEA